MKAFTIFLMGVLSVSAAEVFECVNGVFDGTKGISNICPVHHVRMRKQDAVFHTGPMGIAHMLHMWALAKAANVDFREESKKKFPFPHRDLAWPCEIPPPKRAYIYICEKCSGAEEQWQQEKEAKSATANALDLT